MIGLASDHGCGLLRGQLALVLAVTAAVPFSLVPCGPERIELPGSALELPRSADRGVRWGLREEPTIGEPKLLRKHYVDGLEVGVTLSRPAEELIVDLTWTCDRASWADVRLVAAREDRVELELLATEVVRSIRCVSP